MGIFAVIAQRSFHRATSDGIVKCQLFCQDTSLHEGTLVMWAHVVYKQNPSVVIPVNQTIHSQLKNQYFTIILQKFGLTKYKISPFTKLNTGLQKFGVTW